MTLLGQAALLRQAHPYHAKLARVLERMGGLYTVSDIIGAMADNEMQGFVSGDSWAVTKVAEFPRAKVLEILVALGGLDDCRILHDRILQYARDNDIGLVSAYGRRGWIPDAREHGWKVKAKNYLYHRELQ
jgi:hypothetical protein